HPALLQGRPADRKGHRGRAETGPEGGNRQTPHTRRLTCVLTELRIRNFAIIDAIELEFADGFTVFTGETGAGKSILVDAVDLLVGGRASADLIRSGAEEAEVSGVFTLAARSPVARLLQEQDLLERGETELILRRILSRAGRHRVHVNGRPAPLTILQSLRGLLVDIHGQHDLQSLFKPAVQLDLLDAFGGLADARAAYEAAFAQWRDLEACLTERRGVLAERQAREDLLRYQVEEITGANLRPGGDRLEFDPDRLEKMEERLDLLRRLVKKYGGSLEEVIRRGGQVRQELREMETGEADLKELASQVADAHGKVVKQAQALSLKRVKTAGESEKRLEHELKDLRMDHARVRIAVAQEQGPEGPNLTSAGSDPAELL